MKVPGSDGDLMINILSAAIIIKIFGKYRVTVFIETVSVISI